MTQRKIILDWLRWYGKSWWSMDGYTQRFRESETAAPTSPLDADEWQKFKRDFVEEYGGKRVQPSTGMTNSELLDYIANGYREGDEF